MVGRQGRERATALPARVEGGDDAIPEGNGSLSRPATTIVPTASLVGIRPGWCGAGGRPVGIVATVEGDRLHPDDDLARPGLAHLFPVRDEVVETAKGVKAVGIHASW